MIHNEADSLIRVIDQAFDKELHSIHHSMMKDSIRLLLHSNKLGSQMDINGRRKDFDSRSHMD